MRRTLVVVCLAMVAMPLAGCIGAGPSDTVPEVDGGTDDRTWSTEKGWSTPSAPAEHGILPGEKVFVESFDGTGLAIGVFLPEIDGCDWTADDLPERCRRPVVMDAGPYYLDDVAEPSLRPPIVEWLVPRGYVAVQMSLRGTGESGGCFEFKNPDDVRDVGAVVDWLAEQPWSNAKVGMIGRSYDGTSAWAGAASGSEHLETIVPISGALDGPDLYYKNGTSETRGYIQPTFYYLYAYGLIDDDPTYRVEDWPGTLCPEAGEDWVRGPKAATTGDASSDYWQARDLGPEILDNFDGSAWVIHGLNDWNVNPSQAIPFTSAMRDAGIPTRAWFGQWEHHYPDRVDEHRNVRWDWADELLAWFDFYLEGEGERPWLGTEVEDHLYVWRKEAAYPPPDAERLKLRVGLDGTVAADRSVSWSLGPLEEDLRIAGLVRLHVDATPTTPTGGYLFAELFDVFPDGQRVALGWAAIDLRHHDGGNTDPEVLTPGETVTARMQFEPIDAHLGEGHRLQLVVHRDGVADIAPNPDPAPVRLGAATLDLPTVDRPAEATAPARLGG